MEAEEDNLPLVSDGGLSDGAISDGSMVSYDTKLTQEKADMHVAEQNKHGCSANE